MAVRFGRWMNRGGFRPRRLTWMHLFAGAERYVRSFARFVGLVALTGGVCFLRQFGKKLEELF